MVAQDLLQLLIQLHMGCELDQAVRYPYSVPMSLMSTFRKFPVAVVNHFVVTRSVAEKWWEGGMDSPPVQKRLQLTALHEPN